MSHPAFHTIGYKGNFIHIKMEGNKETITYQMTTGDEWLKSRIFHAQSVHAAKIGITKKATK